MRRAGRRLDLNTVRDLLFHLPRRYEDRRAMHTIAELRDLPDGATASVRVVVRSIHVEQTWRRRVQVTKAVLADETGEAEATWFGRRFIEKRVHAGQHLVVSGRLKQRGFSPVFDDPEFSPEDGTDPLHAGRIVPVYRLTAGLTVGPDPRGDPGGPRPGRPAVRRIPAAQPASRAEGLELIGRAIDQVHYPATLEDRDAALRRLAFDELLALQLGMVGRRRQRGRTTSDPVVVDDARDPAVRAAIVEALTSKVGRPVELTADQSAAIAAIRSDLAGREPMLRLLQGDVGSGKTAVAAHALALVAGLGRQGALLAPTDLLARQHAATVGELLAPLGLGRHAADRLAERRGPAQGGRRDRLGPGGRGGRHPRALPGIGPVRRPGAGGDRRAAPLRGRAAQPARGQGRRTARGATTAERPPLRAGRPHVLLMTATPIPRTLGQVLYADLDVSDLRMAPTGRLPIRTAIRSTTDLDRLWQFVAEEAAQDQRTFVVVPLIEAAEDDAAARRRGRGGPPARAARAAGRARPRPAEGGRSGCRDAPLPRRRDPGPRRARP